MPIITADFETFFDKEYSLTKLSTEGYVNDPRFEVIGVAVKVDDGETQTFSGSKKATAEWLKQFNWEESYALCHNTLFDATILSWHFGINPKVWLDTLSMARALHGTEVGGSLKALAEHYGIGEKGTEIYNAIGKRRLRFTEPELEAYMMYCRNDVDLTYELFKRLAPRFNRTEINLIDMTLRMFVEPSLELSVPILEDSLRDIQFRKLQALQDCGIDKTDLMSNKKFADVLRSLGVEPPMKTSPTTGKPTYAFAKKDEELLSLLEHQDFKVQTVVSSRLQVKETLEETKTQRLIEVAKRTKGKLPVGLKYYGAEVTGRWSAGGDGGALQLQNVARDSKIKEAIVAPEGYKIVGFDLSNIEVRVNLYIAGQQDQLDIITQGLDMYRDFGSKVFNVGYDEITKNQRFISKCAVLSLGFSSGHQVLCKSINLGAKQFGIDVNVDEKEAKRIVNLYREINHRVKDAWYQGEDVLEAVRDNEYYMYKPGFLELPVYGAQGIRLPSGLSIKYPKLARFKNEKGKEEWLYEGRRKVKNRIYGPKVLQNCLAEGTLVLTSDGWKPIETVDADDMVHDGVEFVFHGGKVFKSVQSCVTVDGVYMTPDHEVLTNEGWKVASQNPEPYRPKIWISNRDKTSAQRWKEAFLGVPLRLWESCSERWNKGYSRIQASGNAELRMYDSFTDKQKEYKTRDVKTSSISGMGQHEGQVPELSAPSIQKLWGAWDRSVRQMEALIREFLGGYGTYISARVGVGSYRQQRELHSRELSVGRSSHKHNEQEVLDTVGYSKTICGIWDRAHNTVQQVKSWLASGALVRQTRLHEQKRKVYDILDCGPRNRFVVLGSRGPFIVHNCTQSVARCVMGEAMARINKKYPIKISVHDSCYVVVPEDEAQAAYDFMMAEMTKSPVWAPGLPLAAEGGIGDNLKAAG